MELPEEIKNSLDKSVLCWLATVSNEGIPNVSPKEIFKYYKLNRIIIANIASPKTVKNIKENENVCLSFIDILVQKGYQLKGKAKIIDNKNSEFTSMKNELDQMTAGLFPFLTITEIKVEQVKPIIAPRYIFYPNTTEQEQVKSAKQAYKIDKLNS